MTEAIQLTTVDDKVLVRTKNRVWSRAVVASDGCLYPSQNAAGTALNVSSATVRAALAGKSQRVNLRYASNTEVIDQWGSSGTWLSRNSDGSLKTLPKRAQKKPVKRALKKDAPKRATKKAKKTEAAAAGIPLTGAPEHLATSFLFEGHQFAGGPAIVIVPGTAFRMERASKDDFPLEIRASCHWT